MKRGIALACILAAIPLAAAAQGAADLIQGGRDWDGKTVTFAGEAIGDIMRRGDHAWVNVLDPYAALGVWMTAGQAAEISGLGSYRRTGDKVLVTGTFHRACPEHGGDMDIHALAVVVTQGGSPRTHPGRTPSPWVIAPVFALAGLLFAAWRRREKSLRRAGR